MHRIPIHQSVGENIELSRRYQVPVTMHVAEMTYEMAEFEKAYQKHQLLS